MSRNGKRVWVCIASALALLVGASSISFSSSQLFVLRTIEGGPIPGAYVGYTYVRSKFNFVDSLSRYSPGRLLQSNPKGEVRIPCRWGFKRPFDSQPRVWVNFVYAPALHNALQSGPDSPSIPHVFDATSSSRQMILHDLSEDPELWQRSLENLHSAVRFGLWPDTRQRGIRYVSVSRADIRPLGLAVKREYLALHDRYQDQRRPRPSQKTIDQWPPGEREERLARVEAALAREPLSLTTQSRSITEELGVVGER